MKNRKIVLSEKQFADLFDPQNNYMCVISYPEKLNLGTLLLGKYQEKILWLKVFCNHTGNEISCQMIPDICLNEKGELEAVVHGPVDFQDLFMNKPLMFYLRDDVPEQKIGSEVLARCDNNLFTHKIYVVKTEGRFVFCEFVES